MHPMFSLFRFSHTSIPPGIYKRDKNCQFIKTPNGAAATRLCSVWWDAQVSFLASLLIILHMGPDLNIRVPNLIWEFLQLRAPNTVPLFSFSPLKPNLVLACVWAFDMCWDIVIDDFLLNFSRTFQLAKSILLNLKRFFLVSRTF